MAKVTATVTLLLFTLSLALSVVSSQTENEINLTTLSAEPDPDTTNPTLHGSGSGPALTSPDEITIPVNFMNFHPINRHFPRRPLTTTFFNRRPCHHSWHELLSRDLQIPYGNDMIFSREEKATRTDPSSDGVVVDLPGINMLVGPFAAEEDGSMKIEVKLMKRKEEGEGDRKNMFRRKIRKFLNHLV